MLEIVSVTLNVSHTIFNATAVEQEIKYFTTNKVENC